MDRKSKVDRDSWPLPGFDIFSLPVVEFRGESAYSVEIRVKEMTELTRCAIFSQLGLSGPVEL